MDEADYIDTARLAYEDMCVTITNLTEELDNLQPLIDAADLIDQAFRSGRMPNTIELWKVVYAYRGLEQ